MFKFSCLFSCRNHISVIQCFRLFTALLCLLDTQIYTPRQLSANPHTSAIHKLISHTPKLTLAVYSSLPPITSFSHMSEWPYVITFHTSLCSSQVAWLLSQPPVAIYLLLPLVEVKVMKPRLLLDYAFWIFSVHVLLPPCLFVFGPKSYLSYMWTILANYLHWQTMQCIDKHTSWDTKILVSSWLVLIKTKTLESEARLLGGVVPCSKV